MPRLILKIFISILLITAIGSGLVLAHGEDEPAEKTNPPTQIGLPDAKAGHQHGGAGHGGHAAEVDAHVSISPPGPYQAQTPVDLRFVISDHKTDSQIKDFEKTHDEYLHLITVSSDLEEFSHDHPVLEPDGSFIIKNFKFDRGIAYTMFFDVHSVIFGPLLIRQDVKAGDGFDAKPSLTLSLFPEDIGGINLDLKTTPSKPKAEQEVELLFRLSDSETGKPIEDIEVYLAAPGHLVVLSAADLDYIHAHPAIEVPEDPVMRESARFGPEIKFATSFAKQGDYKGWLQIKRGGKLYTLPFVFNIAPSGNLTRSEIAEFAHEVQKTEEKRAIVKFALLSVFVVGFLLLMFPRRPKLSADTASAQSSPSISSSSTSSLSPPPPANQPPPPTTQNPPPPDIKNLSNEQQSSLNNNMNQSITNKYWILSLIAVLISLTALVSVFYGRGTVNKGADAAAPIPAKPVGVSDIGARADVVPAPLAESRARNENKTVKVELKATQVVAQLADGTTYEYWTYNNQVPGPFIRVMEGDTVEVSLTHEHAHNGDEHSFMEKEIHSFALSAFMPEAFADGDEDHMMDGGHMTEDGHMTGNEEMEHMAEGHGEHSIDLHAVLGPGGGAAYSRAKPNETKVFQFKAMRPGLYIYHCASPHIPSHVANGMYGLILVEPKGGLPAVDKEFYVVEGEFYTNGRLGEKGHQELDKEKLLAEKPEYVVFNGRMGSLTGERALRAKVGDKVRIFFGASGQLASNFHVIGEIFDKLYPEGDIVSPPHKNVQTTLVPAGGAAMVEFTVEVPGKYLLVDHALSRAIDRGAVGEMIVEGPDRPDIFKKIR